MSKESGLRALVFAVRTLFWTNPRSTTQDVYSAPRPKQKQFIEPWTQWLISRRFGANWIRASMPWSAQVVSPIASLNVHLIDFNVYIHGFCDSVFGETLRQFHQKHLPHLFLSAVVAHELLVGAANATREKSLRRGLLEPFRTRQRLHVPARRHGRWQRTLIADYENM